MTKEDYDHQTETSKFNEAELQIMRLHKLWLQAENHAFFGSFFKWNWVLDAIRRELFSDIMKMEKAKQIVTYDNLLRKKICSPHPRDQRYKWLNLRHENLKRLQDDAGKGSIYGYKDTEALE